MRPSACGRRVAGGCWPPCRGSPAGSGVWHCARMGGSQDGTVRLWEAPTGGLLAVLQGHTGGVLGVALSADGRFLSSSSQDGTVRLWEVPGGRLLATLEGHTGGVRGVALSADGRLLASGGQDGTVRLWDPSTAACRRTLRSDRRYERVAI